jgi:hypothetical protein
VDALEYKERVEKMKSINSKLSKVRTQMEDEEQELIRLRGIYSFMPDDDAQNMTLLVLRELDEFYKTNYEETRQIWVNRYEESLKEAEEKESDTDGYDVDMIFSAVGESIIPSGKAEIDILFQDENGQLHTIESVPPESFSYYKKKYKYARVTKRRLKGVNEKTEEKAIPDWKKTTALAIGAALLFPLAVYSMRKR